MKISWEGKTALITGASSGIGAATAHKLAQRGMQVILVARRPDRLLQVQVEIQDLGGKAFTIATDLSAENACQQVFDQARALCGNVDVLVNNAGVGWYGYFSGMPIERFNQMITVNISAVVRLTRLFLAGMLERRSGHIINIGSIAGKMPNQGIAIYGASKAFMDAFTTSLHRELVGSGVHTSVVLPGPVKTEFFDQCAQQSQGRRIPAEAFAIPVERVADAVWSILRQPRRFLYVPWYIALSPWLEYLFAPIIDRLGPLLLKRSTRPSRIPGSPS
jgi:short-subunit dehydrogenase